MVTVSLGLVYMYVCGRSAPSGSRERLVPAIVNTPVVVEPRRLGVYITDHGRARERRRERKDVRAVHATVRVWNRQLSYNIRLADRMIWRPFLIRSAFVWCCCYRLYMCNEAAAAAVVALRWNIASTNAGGIALASYYTAAHCHRQANCHRNKTATTCMYVYISISF